MKDKWVLKEIPKIEVAMPEYPGMVAKLLALRGFTDETSIAQFLTPDYTKLHDPFLFKDMQKAAGRIRRAIEQKEKIVIYADYDADAITACAVMYLGLRKLGGIVEYYIPDRFTEGYGMNKEAVKKIKEQGASVIITVDCGINALEEGALAAQLGLDLIITDHHELTGKLPDAYAIINPKNPADKYPFEYLTGVGVAFKVIQALFQGAGIVPEGWEKWLLDLVAIGTVADLQSLTDENRVLVKFGLTVLGKTRWPGLRALLEAAKLNTNSEFDTYTLGFVIAPRINAAGRIKHADIAFRLLVSENIMEAKNLALELNDLNAHRQMLTQQILSEAKAQAEMIADKKVIVVAGNNWPKGVVGLVAGRLTEEYCRPVLVMDRGETYATGSARSVPEFDLVEALGFAKDTLSRYGGHTQAAGFTLPNENIEALHKKLLEFAELKNYTSSKPSILVDLELDSSEVTWDNYEYLEKFAPFGIGNPRPKFLSRGIVLSDYRPVGAQSQHLKLRLRFGEKYLDAVAFNQGFLLNKLKPDAKIDMVYEITCNEWNGSRELQLKIIDLDIINE